MENSVFFINFSQNTDVKSFSNCRYCKYYTAEISFRKARALTLLHPIAKNRKKLMALGQGSRLVTINRLAA